MVGQIFCALVYFGLGVVGPGHTALAVGGADGCGGLLVYARGVVSLEIVKVKVTVTVDVFAGLEADLIHPDTVVAYVFKCLNQLDPIDLALIRQPMALVAEVVIRNVQGDDFIAQLTHKIDVALIKQVVGVKADTECRVLGDQLFHIA